MEVASGMPKVSTLSILSDPLFPTFLVTSTFSQQGDNYCQKMLSCSPKWMLDLTTPVKHSCAASTGCSRRRNKDDNHETAAAAAKQAAAAAAAAATIWRLRGVDGTSWQRKWQSTWYVLSHTLSIQMKGSISCGHHSM